jgi:hypothetical protein
MDATGNELVLSSREHAIVTTLAEAFGFSEAEARTRLSANHLLFQDDLPDSKMPEPAGALGLVLSPVHHQQESSVEVRDAAPTAPVATTTAAGARSRILWRRIIRRVHEEIDNHNAIVLHPETVYGRLPVTIFSKPLVSRVCGRCLSRRNQVRGFRGRSAASLVLALGATICYVAGAVLAILAVFEQVPEYTYIVATLLLLPQYILVRKRRVKGCSVVKSAVKEAREGRRM